MFVQRFHWIRDWVRDMHEDSAVVTAANNKTPFVDLQQPWFVLEAKGIQERLQLVVSDDRGRHEVHGLKNTFCKGGVFVGCCKSFFVRLVNGVRHVGR